MRGEGGAVALPDRLGLEQGDENRTLLLLKLALALLDLFQLDLMGGGEEEAKVFKVKDVAETVVKLAVNS